MAKIQIEFAPGAFDDFEGTQEELDEMIAELRTMVADGSIQEKATRLSPEEADDILEMMSRRNTRQ
jgi:hypothetical protein